MTLVIAGRNLKKGVFSKKVSDFEEGLFAVADTNITSDNTVLVSGFKKVYEIPVRLKKPNFCDEWFNGYSGYILEKNCFIAFAGSSLVAQHLMNSIRNHLGDIYPTYENGTYKAVMSCETTRHLGVKPECYSEEMFSDRHLKSILTANYVSTVVSHSIQAVLDKAKRHGGMSTRFTAYRAEFILGMQCPISKEYELYEYDLVEDGQGGAKVKVNEIGSDDVAVIGMRKKYASDARVTYKAAIASGETTSSRMHSFLSDAIDCENANGSNRIGKPCGLYLLSGGRLNLEKMLR